MGKTSKSVRRVCSDHSHSPRTKRCNSRFASPSHCGLLWRSRRMKLSTRSYPHPVVGNRDDVPGAAFQASVSMATDRETVFLDVAIKCSSSTINKLVGD